MRGHHVKFRGRRPGTTPLELAQFARAASPHISARFRHRAGRDARVDDGPLEVHRRVIETNLLGYLYGARLVVRIFREQGHGVLVNVSSAVAYVGQPHMSASRVLRYAAQYKDLDRRCGTSSSAKVASTNVPRGLLVGSCVAGERDVESCGATYFAPLNLLPNFGAKLDPVPIGSASDVLFV